MLYLGIVDPSETGVVERRFKLRKLDLDIDKLVLEGGEVSSLTVARSPEKNDEAIVRLKVISESPTGIQTATMRLANDPRSGDQGAIKVPVTWMVLP